VLKTVSTYLVRKDIDPLLEGRGYALESEEVRRAEVGTNLKW
jgi:hypothetical protein